MPIDTLKTGAAIAAYRQRMNLSQQGLAGLMNVTHQAVSKWEKGLALPDTETLLALAKLFGTSMEDLLTGVLPKAPEPEAVPETEPEIDAQIDAQKEPENVPAAEIGHLDFSSIMNMLPFVSTRVADQLFLSYATANQPDCSKLSAIAPFVSTRALDTYVSTHPLDGSSPEVVASLAPFLPTRTVDQMILGMKTPLPQHVVHMLMPFASAKVVDQMFWGSLGLSAQESEAGAGHSDFSQRLSDAIHQKIANKLEAMDSKKAAPKRESPRMRLIRQAAQTGQYDLMEELFDELDDEAYLLLIGELSKSENPRLLKLLCDNAGEMGALVQHELIDLLLKGKRYGELAEVMEELDEDMQHQLLSKAFELNDPELLRLIGEHIP